MNYFEIKDHRKRIEEQKRHESFRKGDFFTNEDETRYQASKLGALGGFPTVVPFTPQAPAPAPAPAPAGPISHSPEIKQAKNRVKAYKDDILTGKVSNDIYGKDKQLAKPQQTSFIKSSNDESSNYQLNLTNSKTDTQKQLQNHLSKYLK